VGTRSNRDGIGAKLTLKTNKGAHLFGMVKTGSSYLSTKRAATNLRLGQTGSWHDRELEIVWPSGHKDTVQRHQAQSVHYGERRKRCYFSPAHCVFQDPPPAVFDARFFGQSN
jgi:hypothetical protein